MFETSPHDLSPILNRIPDAWGKWVSVGAGWYDIVLDLDKQLAKIDPNYEIHQVKEKFGGLRFYCSLETKEANDLIRLAEKKAYKTCEICGKPGSPKTVGGWTNTFCGTSICDTTKRK
jgi:hypothetical protein